MDVNKYRGDIKDLIKEISSLRGVNPEKTIEKCDELLEYGESHRDDALIGFACFTKGETYYLMNDMPSFYLEMLNCMKPFTAIREWGYMAATYNLLGIMALNRGNAPLAMDYYFKAFEYCTEHKLPDIKCMVHMNIAGVYLHVQKYDEAIEYYDKSYKYVSNNMGMEGYVEKLTAILTGKGKAYLGQADVVNARAMMDEAISKCSTFLSGTDRLAIDCFEVRLLHDEEKYDECDALARKISAEFNSAIPVMEVFDDIYDLLTILLDRKLYPEFTNIFDTLMIPVKTTTVKNLEKKLVALKLNYLKESGKMDEFHALSEEYIEILSAMENETTMMLSSMLTLRSNYYDLGEEIKKEKKRSRLLERKSETDPLTGMSNRLKLNDYAEVIFERAITNQVGFAIELLDIDYFKEYNDNYGHQSGDKCILFIANSIIRLSKSQPGIFCSRYGGDEFVIIYESFTEKEVFELAKELKTSIVDAAVEHEYAKGNDRVVTISQGIYWGQPEDGDNVWEYLHEADALLYKVKQKSRNSVMLGKSKASDDPEKKHEKNIHAQRPLITEIKEEEYVPAGD